MKQSREEEYLNGWKRAQADLANYKKDELKRFEEIIKFANEALIRDLLPVLDSLEIAVIQSQFQSILEKVGLQKIKTKIGDKFDPAIHEAIVGEGDLISEILTVGYKLNNKVIRPTRVKVCQKS